MDVVYNGGFKLTVRTSVLGVSVSMEVALDHLSGRVRHCQSFFFFLLILNFFVFKINSCCLYVRVVPILFVRWRFVLSRIVSFLWHHRLARVVFAICELKKKFFFFFFFFCRFHCQCLNIFQLSLKRPSVSRFIVQTLTKLLVNGMYHNVHRKNYYLNLNLHRYCVAQRHLFSYSVESNNGSHRTSYTTVHRAQSATSIARTKPSILF